MSFSSSTRFASMVLVIPLASVAACGSGRGDRDTASAAPAQILEFPGACARVGRVYFFAGASRLDPVELTERYRAEYGLPADTLSTTESSASTADEVLAEARRINGPLAAGMGVVVGVTDLPFNTDTLYAVDGSMALMSTASLASTTNAAALYSRTYKVLTRLLGLTYCRFAPNQNPRSVMYEGLRGTEDLDRIDESIW